MPCTPYCSCNGAASCKSPHTVQTIGHMEVGNEVSVVPEAEEEDSVMESGITDSETTETNRDINSDEKEHDDGEHYILSNYNEEKVEPD